MPLLYHPRVHPRKQYVPDCSHLDAGQRDMDLSAKVIVGRTYPGEDYDASDVTIVEVKFSRPVTTNEAHEAGYDMFERGCSCEPDCCGCVFGGARHWAKRSRNGRRWSAHLVYGRNF